MIICLNHLNTCLEKLRLSKPRKTLSEPEPYWTSLFPSQPQGKDPTVTEEWPAEVLENLAALVDIFDWRADSDGDGQYGKPFHGH